MLIRMRAILLAIAASFAVPAFLALSAAPASAHNELLSSNPADRAKLTALPPAVVLTFAEPANPRFLRIAATGPDGQSMAAGAPVAAGASVRQPLTAASASGRYTVAYRVVSQDGHPVQGSVSFTATLPAAAPTASSAPEPTPSAAAAEPATRPVARVEHNDDRDWLVYGFAAVGLVTVAGITMLLVRIRRRAASAAGND